MTARATVVLSIAAALGVVGACVAPPTEPRIVTVERIVPCATPEVPSPELVLIKGGEFLMGNPVTDYFSDDRRKADGAPRPVVVADFYVAKLLVTAGEYCRFLNDVGNQQFVVETGGKIYGGTIGKDGNQFVPQAGADRCPAYPVTWHGAVGYARWLSKKTGLSLRRPTEAEWEYAARGSELRQWPWGDSPPLLGMDLSWAWEFRFLKKRASAADSKFRVSEPPDRFVPANELFGDLWIRSPLGKPRRLLTCPVGSFPNNATPHGICDMQGYYLPQWCSDVAEPETAREVQRDTQELRIVRGIGDVARDHRFRPLDLLAAPLLGDAVADESNRVVGRSWTRAGYDPRTGALVRLAMSAPRAGE